MISSPGCRSRPIARVSENTLAVVEGPNTNPPGRRRAAGRACSARRSTSASQASAAANWPWLLALLPLRCHAAGGFDRGVDDLRAGRAVEPGPALVVAFGDAGEAVAQVEHGRHCGIRPRPRWPGTLPTARRRRASARRAASTNRSGEVRVGGDRERLGEAVPDDLVVDEHAVGGAVDVREQPSVVVAGDDVALEPDAACRRRAASPV